MNTFNSRLETYSSISAQLANYSDQDLANLLEKTNALHSGIGGQSVLLNLEETLIFVKKIPLTDLERQPQNFRSTANFFELPLFYQYGVGSTGFGVWRELMAHEMATDWVVSGQCGNFPLMYHWRILPGPNPEAMNQAQLEKLKQDVEYWENSPAIEKRLKAIYEASAHIVLFLEYIPETLGQWFGTQLQLGNNIAESAISFVEENLKTTNTFLSTQNFVHFDAHFKNILTDGKLLYFSDFGLALSSKFELSKAEANFLESHLNYDQCLTNWQFIYHIRLQNHFRMTPGELTPFMTSKINQYAPLILAWDDFFQKLMKKSKLTPYPSQKLDDLLKSLEN